MGIMITNAQNYLTLLQYGAVASLLNTVLLIVLITTKKERVSK